MKLRRIILIMMIVLMMIPATAQAADKGTHDNPYMPEWDGASYKPLTIMEFSGDECWIRLDVKKPYRIKLDISCDYYTTKSIELCDCTGATVQTMEVIDQDVGDYKDYSAEMLCSGDNTIYIKMNIDSSKVRNDSYLYMTVNMKPLLTSGGGGTFTNPSVLDGGKVESSDLPVLWCKYTAEDDDYVAFSATGDAGVVESAVIYNMAGEKLQEFEDKGHGTFEACRVVKAGDVLLIKIVKSEAGKDKPVTIKADRVRGVASLSKKSFVYTGKAIKPVVKVTRFGQPGVSLVEDKDYSVKYSGNVSVGKATATVTFYGDYSHSGPETLSYSIIPRGATLRKPVAGKRAITVKWNRQSAKMKSTRITGYQIKLSTNKTYTKGVKTVTVKGYTNTSKKIGKLKAKKRYYFKIRTYKKVNGKTYYSNWSKSRYIRTK